MKIDFKFNDVGLVEREGISAIPVLPNTLKTSDEYKVLVTYIVRIFTLTWTCFVLYLKWKCQIILPSKWSSNVRDILQIALSIIPILMLLSSWADPLKYVKEAINEKTQYNYMDFYTIGKRQRVSNYLDGMVIQFLFCKLLLAMRIHSSVAWIFEAIGRTLFHMLFVCVIMVPVILAFAVYLWFHMG